jgi:hypothetical protein
MRDYLRLRKKEVSTLLLPELTSDNMFKNISAIDIKI